MKQWRAFITGAKGPPGRIDNSDIKARILRGREELGGEGIGFDDRIEISDKSDFYSLSVNFFKFFYDSYGCD